MESFEDVVDLIVFRNAGPVANFKEKYQAFRKRIVDKQLNTYNSFNGKADMNGKEYLLELTNVNFPVIPTIDSVENVKFLPEVEQFIVKPKDGADSIGMKKISKEELTNEIDNEQHSILVQPFIPFEYEVSFYFIDKNYQYALYAPDKDKRWELKEYTPSEQDLSFAQKFIDWNNIDCGIQRVDACRTPSGELLLVELEDLNPYLSLLELSPETRAEFIQNMKESLINALSLNHLG